MGVVVDRECHHFGLGVRENPTTGVSEEYYKFTGDPTSSYYMFKTKIFVLNDVDFY